MTKLDRNRLDYVSVLLKIPRNLLNQFDQYCDEMDYTRLEGIRHVIRIKLKEELK